MRYLRVTFASLALKLLPWIQSRDPVFHRANLTVGTRDFELILLFSFLFFFFIMDALEGRNLKVGLDENTGLTCKLANIQELNIFLIM